MTEEKPAADKETPLESWKEIATYLRRDVRTVKRWEKGEGLPVHRHQHQARASVYAYPSELEAWKAKRQPEPGDARAAAPWRLAPALTLGAVLLLALMSIGSGPILGPVGVAAQESFTPARLAVRHVWTAGQYVGLSGSSLSPDGRYLTYTDWTTGDLAVHDLVTGENRRLTNKGPWSKAVEFAESFSRFSTDGKQVAYIWDRQGGYELRVINLDGTGSRLVYRNKEGKLRAYDWSADGKYIAAALPKASETKTNGAAQIALIRVADGSVRGVRDLNGRLPANMSFSPDDRFLAYDLPANGESEKRDIFVLDLDGGQERPAITHPADDRLLGWTPEGAGLLFASDRAGTTGVWLQPLHEGKLQGSAESVRGDLGEGTSGLGFTRNGAYYYAISDGVSEVYTASLDLEKGILTDSPAPASPQILGSNAGPEWSPDGKFLAYIHGGRRVHPESIVLRSLETGEERSLTPETMKGFSTPGWGERYLRWSPDGRRLLANGTDNNNRRGLFLIDVATGEASPVAIGRRQRYGRWSHDGKGVFYVHLGGEKLIGQIVRRELDTGQEKVLYGPDSPRFLDNFGSLEPSPDGRWLAFSGFALGKDSGEETVLMVMPAEGGEPKLLLQVPASDSVKAVGWTPDGREVLFTRDLKMAQERSTALWRIRLEGGEPRKLELGMNVLNDIRFHPNARRAAFDSGESRAQIWVMENFLTDARGTKAKQEQ